MKKRRLLLTAVSAALILAYSVGFRAESIVEEEAALPESLGAAPGDFMKTFWHPLGEERGCRPCSGTPACIRYSPALSYVL